EQTGRRRARHEIVPGIGGADRDDRDRSERGDPAEAATTALLLLEKMVIERPLGAGGAVVQRFLVARARVEIVVALNARAGVAIGGQAEFFGIFAVDAGAPL